MDISKKETSGKMKFGKSRLTGQHEAELKQLKHRWDVTLNVPARDDREGIMASTKSSQIHSIYSYGALIT